MLNAFPAGSAVHINRICRYLALDDFAGKVDLIAVFGNQVLATVCRACSLLTEGLTDRLLFSGGIGHSTNLLFSNIAESPRFGHLARSGAVNAEMSEADMFAVIAAVEFGISRSQVLVENRSTNTGENARFSLELIRDRMPEVGRILLIQDPVMQRRTALTMKQTVMSLDRPPLLFSHSVFVPEVDGERFVTPSSMEERPPWTVARFVSLMLGEVERLRNDEQGYGPRGRGFIPAEDIPDDVLASYESVKIAVAA